MSHVIKVRNIPLRYSPNLDFKRVSFEPLAPEILCRISANLFCERQKSFVNGQNPYSQI